jgi:cation transport regulator ChaC
MEVRHLRIKYFAYGSNMSTARLKARVPSCVPISAARLAKHELRFHKRSRDGSAKCDAFATSLEGDLICGVIFEIEASEKAALDRVEGVGAGYNAANVTVTTTDGLKVEVTTYLADRSAIDPDLRPFDWYKAYVLKGASEHQLPDAYVKRYIEDVPSIVDAGRAHGR